MMIAKDKKGKAIGVVTTVLFAFVILGFGANVSYVQGYEAGRADGFKKSAQIGEVVMTAGEAKTVDLHQSPTYARLLLFYDGHRTYVCGEKGRWGSALERIMSDPVYDRDGRLIGIVPYGPPESR